MRATLACMLAAGLLAGACGSSVGDRAADDGRSRPVEVTANGSRPEPLVSALPVTGAAVLDPSVQVVDLDHVLTVGPDGTTLLVADTVEDLAVGALFVVPGVASGRVTSAGPADGGSVQVHFEQPPVEDLFRELDVTFEGTPDPDAVLWRTDDQTAAGHTGAVEFLELAELEDLEDPEQIEGPRETDSPGQTPPSGDPDEQGALPPVPPAPLHPVHHLGAGPAAPPGPPAAHLAVAAGDGKLEDGCGSGAPADGEGNEPGGDLDERGPGDSASDSLGDPGGGDDGADAPEAGEGHVEGMLGSPSTQNFSFKVEAYTVEVRHRLATACGNHAFKINASRGDELSLTASTFGWVRSERVGGGMALGADGVRTDTYLDISGEVWFSVSGQVKEPGRANGLKITYDVVKRDIPVVVAGVPFLIRLGVPLTLEARLPSRGDTLTATLLHLTCDGRIGTSGIDTPDSTCTMAPVTPHIAESFGPMAFIAAVGFKAGFGPGVTVPLPFEKKTRLYAGATATLSASTGLLRSGTAGAPLIDCSRIDRSVQLNLGAEAQVFRVVDLSTSTNVWKKEATDHWGRQCSVSDMAG